MGIVEISEKIQHVLEDKFKNFGRGKYGRILKMARKPTYDEYMRIVWIVGLGILLLGALGFLIYYLMAELPKLLT
ncbi:MAG: protein translocase SEC61 complex subunit gamma [Thermoplasmata archaeon]|nr:protein translocase SEC61 complex subunit gamma [Thermoplasmata archaeon]